jgi:alkylation response protein AidB-like acyl-CoA dehydrogenase
MPSTSTGTAAEIGATQDSPGFLNFLDAAATPWHRLPCFPLYEEEDQRDGDDLVATVAATLAGTDPDEVDRTATLPDGLVQDLRDAGLLALRNGSAHGGLEASDYNTFRVVERAARTSVAIAQLIAVQNGIGVAALLPILPPGPLHAFIAQYVSAGTVSGSSDTEPAGQNNSWRDTTATPTADGAAYVLNGAKKFTTNAPVAGVIVLTAAVQDTGGRLRLGLVFLDMASPGVTVGPLHEFLGSRGLPNASLRFDAVRVPAEQVLLGSAPSGAGQPPSVGRLLINAAPALAIARECLAISREFVAGRAVDGRPLGDYDQIQRFTATTIADIHAMDSVVRWCLLGHGDRGFEQALAKNICTVAAWQVADRTLSVLGGEGLETARSKRRRGAAALPVERLLRDARGLRVAGNVDFMVDIQAGRTLLTRHSKRTGQWREWPDLVDCAGLSAANCRHVTALVTDTRRLSRTCADLAERFPDPDTVPGGQETHRLIGHIAGVLLTMFTVLSRAAHVDAGEDVASELTDVHCTAARHRLVGQWAQLSEPPRDFGRISRV